MLFRSCDEKVRVRPVSLGGGEDTSRVRVENLVPLGLDDEDIEPRTVRASLVTAVGVGRSLLATPAPSFRLRLNDCFDAMVRHSLVDTIVTLVVLEQGEVVDPEKIGRVLNVGEGVVRKASGGRRMVDDKCEVAGVSVLKTVSVSVCFLLIVIQ